jgi:hypothetical protein
MKLIYRLASTYFITSIYDTELLEGCIHKKQSNEFAESDEIFYGEKSHYLLTRHAVALNSLYRITAGSFKQIL